MPSRKSRTAETTISVHQTVIIEKGGNGIVTGVGSSPPNPEALRRYLERVARDCESVEFEDLLPPAPARPSQAGLDTPTDPLRLAEVFIGLNTTEMVAAEANRDAKDSRPHALKASPVQDADSGKRRPLGALEAVTRNRCLLLKGEPGSGKSTFLRYLALCLARHRLETKSKKRTPPIQSLISKKVAPIPIRIELRLFAARHPVPRSDTSKPSQTPGQAGDLKQYIEDWLKENSMEDAWLELKQALGDGTAIVFLDGLDEIPHDEQRQFVCEAVNAFAGQVFATTRVVVTCRTASYDQGWAPKDFPINELARLDAEEGVPRFVRGWYKELHERGHLEPHENPDHLADSLCQAIARNELHNQAGNPMTLTNMALLHRHEKLPNNRAQLWQALIEQLLFRRDRARYGARGHEGHLLPVLLRGGCRESEFHAFVARLAWEAHDEPSRRQSNQGSGSESAVEICREAVRRALEALGEAEQPSSGSHSAASKPHLDPDKKLSPRHKVWIDEVLRVLDRRGGLLRPSSRSTFTLPHRSYQEFLAARHLVAQPNPIETVAGLIGNLDGDYSWWREVIRWVAGIQTFVRHDPDAALALVARLGNDVRQGNVNSPACYRASLAVEIVNELGLDRIRTRPLGVSCLDLLRPVLVSLLTCDALPARDRARAGTLLGWLGDDRAGVGVKEWEGREVPDLAWSEEIGPGEFVMGGEGFHAFFEERRRIEKVYRVGKYPVTARQFEVFAREGYEERRYWTITGWERRIVDGEEIPDYWGREARAPNHPVVGVSFDEAVAFCRWLNERVGAEGMGLEMGWKVRLPTEEEWERAARGERGRSYPWGAEGGKDVNVVAARCNCGETGLGGTSTVGLFAGRGAECGAEEMAGNVWEWCTTKWRQYLVWEADEDPEGDFDRVLHGGSWHVNAIYARCASRFWNPPDYRNGDVGFRLAASPFP